MGKSSSPPASAPPPPSSPRPRKSSSRSTAAIRKELLGFHDIYEPKSPPHRRPIPICAADDRIGTQRVWVDPKKIVGIVHSNRKDEVKDFSPVTDVTTRIGHNVAEFLAAELRNGHIPKEFLPIQSGVGNVANAVLGGHGRPPGDPALPNVYRGHPGLRHRADQSGPLFVSSAASPSR